MSNLISDFLSRNNEEYENENANENENENESGSVLNPVFFRHDLNPEVIGFDPSDTHLDTLFEHAHLQQNPPRQQQQQQQRIGEHGEL